MIVTILDGQGAPHVVVWQGQGDLVTDFSGNLLPASVGGAAAPQPVAVANSLRAGFLFQNTSRNAMLLWENGNGTVGSPWVINSGAFFPPPGYPVPTGIIAVQGSVDSVQGDTFTYREWQNSPNE